MSLSRKSGLMWRPVPTIHRLDLYVLTHTTSDAKIILSICSRSLKHVSLVFRLHYPIGQEMFWRGNRCRLGLTMTTSQPLTASESLALPGEVKKLNDGRKWWRMYKVELYILFSDVGIVSTLIPKVVWKSRVHSVEKRDLHDDSNKSCSLDNHW